MSEIERAIECFNNKVWSGELFESEVDMYNAVIGVLRAELEREKNAPLTAEQLAEMVDSPIFVVYKSTLGATIVRKWSIPYMVHEGTAHCTDGENWYPAPNCHIYRYEPKGEKA